MADTKISAGADPVTLVGTDKVPVARSASTTAYAATMTEVAAFASTGRAPLASPVFTGDPQAPTPAEGDSDTSIATTAFVSAAVATSLHDVGRNYIHNSMFNIAQRGAGPFTTSVVTLDRWWLFIGADTASITQYAMTDADRTAIGDEAAIYGAQNVFVGSAAAGGAVQFVQAIEGVRRLGGKTVIVSFYAKASSGSPALGVRVSQNFGTGGSPSASNNTAPQTTSPLTTAWTRYAMTFVFPSAAGKTLGSNGNDSAQLLFGFSAGSTNAPTLGVGVQSGTVQLWGVQLEIGPTATPLEKLDPVTQLQQCQRFFQASSFYIQQYNTAGGSSQQRVPLSMPMRATPVITPTPTVNVNATSPTIAADTQTIIMAVTATAAGAFAWGGTYTASADL